MRDAKLRLDIKVEVGWCSCMGAGVGTLCRSYSSGSEVRCRMIWLATLSSIKGKGILTILTNSWW